MEAQLDFLILGIPKTDDASCLLICRRPSLKRCNLTATHVLFYLVLGASFPHLDSLKLSALYGQCGSTAPLLRHPRGVGAECQR